MGKIQVACSSITWRRMFPEEQVLAEIAQAGYEGAPAGVRDDRSPEETLAVYARYGLKPAPGYLGAAFWDPAQAEEIVAQAEKAARYMQGLGCTELYVAASLTPRRREIAGQVQPADAMSEAEHAQCAKVLDQVGQATLKYGVKACFHNHVGSYIERRAEIDRLFALVNPQWVFQGPDLGHLAWAGDDVVAFCQDYAKHMPTVHLKDINPQVRQEGVKQGWGYRDFSDHGIFAELGEGMVDFPAILDALNQAGFEGWIVVETDVTQKPTALESAIISRKYLRSIGL